MIDLLTWTFVIIAIVLSIIISDMKRDESLSKEEDGLLFSNLISIGALFLAILLVLTALAATKGAALSCNQSANAVANTLETGCNTQVAFLLNVINSGYVTEMATLLLFAVIIRPILYSRYKNRGTIGKMVLGFIVWIAILLPVFVIISDVLHYILLLV